MAKVISISNHKGGVGKTTTSLNLGAALNRMGYKVLLIDMDAQANLTISLGISEEMEDTIYSALRGRGGLKPIKILDGLDLVPSELDLSGAEVEMASEAGKEFVLSELLEPFKEQYDYIILDTPPSLGILTLNAFTASDSVIMVLQAQYFALHGLGKLNQVIGLVQKRLNKGLKVGGVVITQYDSRESLNRAISEQIQELFAEWKDSKVYDTKIRKNVALAEAPTQGLDIFRYAPKSYGAEDYTALAQEVAAEK